jgi:DNA-binding response OmpR family regulator
MAEKRVLVVEDDVDICALVAIKLESEGFAVVQAFDGTTGLMHAKNGGFDVIILDIMMPGMSGLDVLTSLRAAGNTTPVLILTAKVQEHDIEAGFAAGADDYVTKPFSPRELLARVHSVLARAGGAPALR